MRKWMLAFAVWALAVAPSFAETIQLKTDTTVHGRILEETDQYIQVDAGVGTPLTFYRDEIESISPDGVEEVWDVPAVAATVQNAGARHFLWRVASSSATVYLFGSIHLGKPEMYPLAPAVEQAFDSVSDMVVEVDIDSIPPMEAQAVLMTRGAYDDGSTIQDHIRPSTLEKLRQRVGQFGLPWEQMAMFKPWLIGMTLSVAQIKQLGYDENYGVEKYFLRKARGQKNVRQLETFEEQINFFESIREQDQFLEYTLGSMDETERMLEDFLKAWGEGDAETVDRLTIRDMLEKYPDTAPILDILIFDRNVNMARQVEGFLADGGTYFVIVGAAHLVGERGIVELLRRDGYQVDQVGDF